jgi:uncharacterized membrane protein YraQ (UPF0718 family)
MARLVNATRRYGLLLAVLVAYAVVALRSPLTAMHALLAALRLLRDVGPLLAGIYLFLGVFEEWVSPARLSRLIGREAGSLKALAVAFAFGSWGSGPVYATYPIAALFLRSGARVATAVTFLSAWQVVKLTMLPFEMQLLGVRFALLRAAACALVPIPAGLATEAILRVLHRAPHPRGPASPTEQALRDVTRRLE